MKTRIRFEEFKITEAFENGTEISLDVPDGNMMPTMREFYDTVTVKKPRQPLKKNDVVIYYNENEELVLSRIVYINGGKYSLSGDGQKETEYNIPEGRIVGIVTDFERKDKTISADNKYYQYYLMLLPVVKAIYSFYFALKTKVQNFLKFLIKR